MQIIRCDLINLWLKLITADCENSQDLAVFLDMGLMLVLSINYDPIYTICTICTIYYSSHFSQGCWFVWFLIVFMEWVAKLNHCRQYHLSWKSQNWHGTTFLPLLKCRISMRCCLSSQVRHHLHCPSLTSTRNWKLEIWQLHKYVFAWK